MAVLERRASHAITEPELKQITGVTGTSFKEVLIRLVRKRMVVKWKNERYVNYIVAAQYANEAYYDESLSLDPLYLATGHSIGAVTIKRTIPFVLSPDEDVSKPYHNRYRDADTTIA